ncbi:hypothetical protein [Clostridium sp. 1xD42-85]|uniref:hypothetical protein n=1 Tax=Clostridium sp. 1xD42-85 TaxID=2320084 RepID=UPI001A9AD378|nr:hypothetical protein [Clostridium sp. 1xD42-85]
MKETRKSSLVAVKQTTLHNWVSLHCNKHVNENTDNGTYLLKGEMKASNNLSVFIGEYL